MIETQQKKKKNKMKHKIMTIKIPMKSINKTAIKWKQKKKMKKSK